MADEEVSRDVVRLDFEFLFCVSLSETKIRKTTVLVDGHDEWYSCDKHHFASKVRTGVRLYCIQVCQIFYINFTYTKLVEIELPGQSWDFSDHVIYFGCLHCLS